MRASDLHNQITQLLARGFPEPVKLSGTVRQWTRSSSGHVYFTLRCPERVSCVVLRDKATVMPDLAPGQSVEVEGSLSLHDFRVQVMVSQVWDLTPADVLAPVPRDRAGER